MGASWQPSAEQREILRLNAGRHLVLAPPGTGKTELLAHRVLEALRNGIPPDRMLCLTFTVRAAARMEEKIRDTVRGTLPRARLPELGNFHHWCHQFLFEGTPPNLRAALGRDTLVPRHWQVVDEDLQADLMRETLDMLASESPRLGRDIDTLRDRGGQLPVDALLAHAARSRQLALRFPEDVLSGARGGTALESAPPGLLRRIADAYRRRKETYRLLDFDDLLLYAYYFVAIKKCIPDSGKCTWVQIDEVQDLTPLQWGLVRALSAPGAHQVFFGDPEQSIFSFLGARRGDLERIREACDAFHPLARNYRSAAPLLGLTARYALATLDAGWDAPPVPQRRGGAAAGAPLLEGVPRDTPQEDWLAARLRREAGAAAAFPPTAILTRTNRRADDFERALRAAGLEVCKIAGDDWTARPEVRDFKAFLAVLARPGDRMAWARLWRLFAGAPSHAAARDCVSALFAAGLGPADLLTPESPHPASTPLDGIRCAADPGRRIVVFDTETTGLDPRGDDIVQLAALELVGGKPARAFNRFLQTDRDLSATECIHHISRAFLDANGEPPADVLRAFLDFAGDAPLAGHNVGFDRAFLANALRRHGLPPLPRRTAFIDTLDASRRLHPELKSHKLAALVSALRLSGANTHRADDDVEATANLLLRLAGEANARTDTLHGFLRAFLRDNAGAIGRFRETFLPLWTDLAGHPGRRSTFRRAWGAFLGAALAAAAASGEDAGDARCGMDRAAGKFLRYADREWGAECRARPFLDVVRRKAKFLARFKEVDLLVGDEPIVVSTVHRAKGLEFPRVVVPDAQDGVYPGPFDKTDADRRESARILYVAMTRARDRLLLLHTGAPSPFLEPVLGCFGPDRAAPPAP